MVGHLQSVSRDTPEHKGKASRQGTDHDSDPNRPPEQ